MALELKPVILYSVHNVSKEEDKCYYPFRLKIQNNTE